MQATIDIIGQVLYAKYKSSQLSKRELADRTGLALNTVTNAVSGKNLTLISMLKIMDALGINLSDLVSEAEKMGLQFPKPGEAPPTINTDKVKEMIDEGQSTLQVASRLGMKTEELEEVIEATKVTQGPQEVFEVV